MSGSFQVRYTDAAREDLLRLFDFLLQRCTTAEDFEAAQIAVDAIRAQVEQHLSSTPLIFRKSAASPFLRELVIGFGRAGYVALYEVQDAATVNVLAVRHQREDDYH